MQPGEWSATPAWALLFFIGAPIMFGIGWLIERWRVRGRDK